MDEIQKQIEAIEKEIRETPYHKGTEHHIGKLRARIARLRDRILEKQIKKSGGGGGGFGVRKFGDATVILVGFPSVGKSTLLNALTNAKSPTAEYAFTTVTVIPGMMKYRDASIQILDVPGLIEGASHGSGHGREVLSVIRSADLLLIIAQAGHERDFTKINKELYLNRIRINQMPPPVIIKKTFRGGIKINAPSRLSFSKDTVAEIAREYGLINAEIIIKANMPLERLIDSFSQNRVFIPAIYVLNKADLSSQGDFLEGYEGIIKISAKAKVGLGKLQEEIWQKLGFVRIYLKNEWNMNSDFGQPLIMFSGKNLKDVADKVGNDFSERKKNARIWGKAAKYQGQKVSLKTVVQDGMEVLFE